MWSRIDGSMFTSRSGASSSTSVAFEPGGDGDDLLQPLAQLDALRPDVDRLGVEARQVEQLLDERGHAHRLLLERSAQLRLLRVVEPVAEMVQRLDETVDRRHRRPQLVRGERDEVGHHLVRALAARAATRAPARRGAPGRARRRSSRRRSAARAARCRRRRARSGTSRRGTSRREPRSSAPRGCPAARAARRPPPRCASRRRGRARRAARRARRGRPAAPAPTSAATGPKHAVGHLAPRRRQRHQAADRLLQALLLAGAPEAAHDARRRDPEQEAEPRDGGEGRRQGLDDRVVAALERRADDRDRQRRSREREQPHAPARDARLAATRPPETNRDDDREQRPVDEEEDDVRR